MEYRTTNQAAQRLEISRTRVLILIRDGRLPAQKIGRDWMILEKDLESFANQPRHPGRPWHKDDQANHSPNQEKPQQGYTVDQMLDKLTELLGRQTKVKDPEN